MPASFLQYITCRNKQQSDAIARLTASQSQYIEYVHNSSCSISQKSFHTLSSCRCTSYAISCCQHAVHSTVTAQPATHASAGRSAACSPGRSQFLPLRMREIQHSPAASGAYSAAPAPPIPKMNLEGRSPAQQRTTESSLFTAPSLCTYPMSMVRRYCCVSSRVSGGRQRQISNGIYSSFWKGRRANLLSGALVEDFGDGCMAVEARQVGRSAATQIR